MGAKQAYFPTTSGRAHKTFLQKAGKFGGGALKTPEPAIGLLGENGELDKAAIAIIDFLREHSKMTLCTGHCAAHETDALVRYALSHGIKNVVANHPYIYCGGEFEQIEAWAKLGAFIEITAVSVRGVSKPAKISRESLPKCSRSCRWSRSAFRPISARLKTARRSRACCEWLNFCLAICILPRRSGIWLPKRRRRA